MSDNNNDNIIQAGKKILSHLLWTLKTDLIFRITTWSIIIK